MLLTHTKLLRAIAVNAGYDNIWDYIQDDAAGLKYDLSANSSGQVSGNNLIDWLIDCGAKQNPANKRYYLMGIELQ